MKKILLLSAFLTVLFSLYGQVDTSRTLRKKDYSKFVGQILSTNETSIIPAISIDASENPTLKFAIPPCEIFSGKDTGVIGENRRFFFSINGKISATNNYTFLLSKGKWKPNTDVGVNITYLLNRRKMFYKDEIAPATKTPIEQMKISDASRVFFTWINARAGYNYSKYAFYNADSLNVSYTDRTFDRKYNSFFFMTSFNAYFYPSRKKLGALTLYGSVGFSVRTNDNNFDELEKFKITKTESYTNGSNGMTEAVVEEGTYRKGNFIVGTSYSVPLTATALLSDRKRKFYVGVTLFGKYKNIARIGTWDFGTALNFPIQKANEDGSKPILNLAVELEFKDVANRISGIGSFDERLRLGFKIGVPFISHR